MEFDFDDTMTRALWRYARSVTSALGLGGDCWCVHGEDPVGLYLALDGRLDGFPDRDVALLWDEVRGWSAVVESDGGVDLVVARLEGLAVARPAAVARWVAELFGRPGARSWEAGGLVSALRAAG
ncbi:DUF6292 family protein [Actinosynnema sp. NPDC020468]|uniref:DUF6292 family protein n=1 Tax=Actinosynnema sp. NPDC020468 TaxID=3154488 RepID=UPI0033C2426F